MKSILARNLLVGLLLAAGTWQGCHAQQPKCLDSDTVTSCRMRLAGKDPALAAAVETASDKQGEASDLAENLSSLLAAINTGDASATTISDFLPLIRLLLDTGGSTADLPDKIGAEWNNPIPLGRKHQHKLAAMLVKSEIFEPLKLALQGAGFSDQASNLEDDIDQGDDVRFSLSYSPASEAWGRDPDLEPNHEILSAILHDVSQIQSTADSTVEVLQANQERAAFIAANSLGDLLRDPDTKAELPFTNIPEQHRARYIELTAALQLAQLKSLEELATGLEEANFYQVIDLVNNQPQLVISADYNVRDEVTGPDEISLKVSYEGGGPSLKQYRKYRKGKCAGTRESLCLANYLEQTEVKEGLANGSMRFRFNAEYVKHERLEFALPDTSFTYLAEPVEHLMISAGLGRYFGRELVGRKRARFDATASYEDFSDDPLRQDRGLATVSVTYPISEGFFLSAGLVYATKPEFRGDVDEEISARAGFTYKILEEN